MVVMTYLSAEVAGVCSVLPDLHLLDGLSERSSVSDSVLSGDTHFLGSLGLKRNRQEESR